MKPSQLWSKVRRFLNEEHGANGVECALIVGLFAVALVFATDLLGAGFNSAFAGISKCVSTLDQRNCPAPFLR